MSVVLRDKKSKSTKQHVNNSTVISYFCLLHRNQIGLKSCHNFSYDLEKWFPRRVCEPPVITAILRTTDSPSSWQKLQLGNNSLLYFLKVLLTWNIFFSQLFFIREIFFCSQLSISLSFIHSMQFREHIFLSLLPNWLLQIACRKLIEIRQVFHRWVMLYLEKTGFILHCVWISFKKWMKVYRVHFWNVNMLTDQ